MHIIFMSYLGTQAVTNVSRRSKPINLGMYERHCTSKYVVGIGTYKMAPSRKQKFDREKKFTCVQCKCDILSYSRVQSPS